MNEKPLQMSLEIETSSLPGVPLERIEEDARQLHEDLRQIHVDSIEPLSGATRQGAKSPATPILTSFLLAVAPDLVKQALSILLDWVRRDSSRSIKIRETKGGPEYVLTGSWNASDLAKLMSVLAKQEQGREQGS